MRRTEKTLDRVRERERMEAASSTNIWKPVLRLFLIRPTNLQLCDFWKSGGNPSGPGHFPRPGFGPQRQLDPGLRTSGSAFSFCDRFTD